jgi:hypothetical protein
MNMRHGCFADSFVCVAEVSDMAQTMSEASRQYYKDAKYVNLQVSLPSFQAQSFSCFASTCLVECVVLLCTFSL